MMNINIIPPREGYLERVRELTAAARRQADLRRGQDRLRRSPPAAPPSASASTPDMITLAKASCGGYPGGAIGMSDELGEVVADGTVKQYGTFNGNPLVMAAAEATLTKVLTDDVYETLRGDQPASCSTAARQIIDAVRPARLHRGPRRQGLRRLLAGAAVRVPRLPDQGRRRALAPGLALPHEPRHLHDARAPRRSGRSRSPTPPRTSSATSTPSRPSPATSPVADADRGAPGATSRRSPLGTLDAMTSFWEPGTTDEIHGVVSMRAPEGIREWFSNTFGAVPDFRMEVLDVLADGEKVAVRWQMTGTFNGDGPLRRSDRDRRRARPRPAATCSPCATARSSRNDAYLNAMQMARQLGVLPPQGSGQERAMIGAVNLKTRAPGCSAARPPGPRRGRSAGRGGSPGPCRRRSRAASRSSRRPGRTRRSSPCRGRGRSARSPGR